MPRDCKCYDLANETRAIPDEDVLTHMIYKYKTWRPGLSRKANILSGIQQNRHLLDRRRGSPSPGRVPVAYSSQDLIDFIHTVYEPVSGREKGNGVSLKVPSLAEAGLCYFGKQSCEIVGPCANCALVHRRNAILRKHDEEFPDIEVTAQRLVAPNLSEIITLDLDAQRPVHCPPGESVLKLPELHRSCYRYMRKVAGSGKEKKKKFYPQPENTMKTYIEIRLPKV